MVDRVIATPAALELIAQLKAEYGDILFHQSAVVITVLQIVIYQVI